MKWYLAKIVFQIVCGEGSHTPQFDEQLRLISANDNEAAFYKAQTIGEQEQESFYNQQQKLVQWKFINVPELYCLSGQIDGAEMYSRIREVYQADNYINEVHEKAERVLVGELIG